MTLYVQRTRISSITNCEGVETDVYTDGLAINRCKVPNGEASSEQDDFSVYLKNDDSDWTELTFIQLTEKETTMTETPRACLH